MSAICQDTRTQLARGPGEPLAVIAATHLDTCDDCRGHAAVHDRLIAALRVEPEAVDEVARARWLARMGPELDAIAERRTAPRSRRWWAVPGGAFVLASVAVVLAWWAGRASAPHATAPVAVQGTHPEELAVLRPYVVSRAASDTTATTLLAGRFSAIDVGPGELVRASLDATGGHRIAVVGPARISVTRVGDGAIDMAIDGVILVDARGDDRLELAAPGGLVVRAQHASFAVESRGGQAAVFVDRGELEIGGARLRAGDWSGPESLRSSLVVQQLRDHANAIAPAVAAHGIVAITGDGPIVTRRGEILGLAPLWARMPVAAVEVVTTGAHERAAAIDVRSGEITRVSLAAPAPSPTATPASDLDPAQRQDPPIAPTQRSKRDPVRATDPPAPASALGVGPARAATAGSSAPATAAELYARAEAALRAGDRAGAEATWLELVDRFEGSASAASALYDLATLARRREPAAARRYLAQLLANAPPDALLEPAHYLACRLDTDAGANADAAACFTRFRALFPRSSHDAEILAWLAGHAERTTGCAAAEPLFREYLARYPTGPFAARATACGVRP